MVKGYIDPGITPNSNREAALLALIRTRGLSLHRLHRDGGALRLSGPDIHITVAALSNLQASDLAAPTSTELRSLQEILRRS